MKNIIYSSMTIRQGPDYLENTEGNTVAFIKVNLGKIRTAIDYHRIIKIIIIVDSVLKTLLTTPELHFNSIEEEGRFLNMVQVLDRI